MQRKDFIVLSFYSTIAVSIPLFGCSTTSAVANRPWVAPWLLSHICDTKTLKEIGTEYRQKYPSESDEEQLAHLLLTNSNNKIISINTENAAIRSLLDKKVKNDFEVGNTIIIKGWVLSKTEAQQCALFSFSDH